MEKLEKIERLREKANVTYEEARDALEQAGDDLLDAIVLLEKQGKVKEPQQSTYSTQYDEQEQYVRVVDKVEEQRKSAPSFGKVIHSAVSLIMHSSFHITRREQVLFTLPSLVLVLILIIFWKVAVPVGIIALFFGVRYSFEGKDGTDTKSANDILDKAGAFADGVESEMRKDDQHTNEG